MYVIMCEYGREIITCQNGKVINVLDANWGRLNRHTCIDRDTSNINCRSSNSLKLVQDECNGKTSCELRATNSKLGGDPCPGIHKYLEIKYKCL